MRNSHGQANWLYERALAYAVQGEFRKAEQFQRVLERLAKEAILRKRMIGAYRPECPPPEKKLALLLRMKMGQVKSQRAKRQAAASYQARESWLREPCLRSMYIPSGATRYLARVRPAPFDSWCGSCPCGSGKIFLDCHGKDPEKL